MNQEKSKNYIDEINNYWLKPLKINVKLCYQVLLNNLLKYVWMTKDITHVYDCG